MSVFQQTFGGDRLIAAAQVTGTNLSEGVVVRDLTLQAVPQHAWNAQRGNKSPKFVAATPDLG